MRNLTIFVWIIAAVLLAVSVTVYTTVHAHRYQVCTYPPDIYHWPDHCPGDALNGRP